MELLDIEFSAFYKSILPERIYLFINVKDNLEHLSHIVVIVFDARN